MVFCSKQMVLLLLTFGAILPLQLGLQKTKKMVPSHVSYFQANHFPLLNTMYQLQLGKSKAVGLMRMCI